MMAGIKKKWNQDKLIPLEFGAMRLGCRACLPIGRRDGGRGASLLL